jgi:ribose 5-phosphate isomerase A
VDVDAARRAAGAAAVPLVADGMRVGLGTGSTAHWFILGLAERVRQGLSIRAVATSAASAALAIEHGIAIDDLGPNGLDIAVDGADSVDPSLRLIKGKGGAMLREKIVASSAARFVVIVDESKYSTRLHGRVPVEVIAFGSARTVAVLSERTSLGFALRTGGGGSPIVTDNGNLIADSDEGDIDDPTALAAIIEAIPGCAGHGLFLGMTHLVLVGRDDGSVEELTARAAARSCVCGDTVASGG